VAFGRLSQSRGGTPIDVRTPMGARPSPQARSNYPLRLSAFRLRISFVLPVRSVRQSMPKRSSHGAIHRRSPAGLQHGPPAQASETTPFCERLCPVVTRKRQWLGIARALSRAARTMRLIRPREAGEGDHAKHGGGGAQRNGSPRRFRPHHRATRGPPPPYSRGRIIYYRFNSAIRLDVSQRLPPIF
jgi:hypothetical protein